MSEVIEGFKMPNASGWYVSPVAGEQTKTLKSGAGQIHYGRFCNTTAAVIYVFVFDSLTASGTLLCAPFPVPANGSVELKTFMKKFTTGCTVSCSSTQVSFTIAGANALQIDALVS